MEGVKGRGRLRVPARASLWYIASSAVARSVSVVGTPIFTRLLTPTEYGAFPHYMTYFSLFSAVATLELSGGVILRGLQKFSDRRDRLISSAVGLCFTAWATVCLLYFTVSAVFGDFTGLGRSMMAVLLIHVMLNAVISIYTARERFEYRYKTVAAVNITTAIASPILAISLIYLTSLWGRSRPFAAAISAGLIAIPFLIIILRRSPRLYDGEIWKFLLKFNLPLLPHYICAAVILRIGEVALSRIHGNEALARYSVSMSVGLSLTVITNGLLSALSPWLLRRVREGRIRESGELLYLAARGLCLTCLVILSIVPETIRIVSPPEYHDCLFAVYPLALSVIPTFLSSAVTSGEMYFEKSGATSLPTVVSAAVCVVLTLLLVPYTDYRLTALLVLLSYVLMCALNCIVFRRLSGEMPFPLFKLAGVFSLTVLLAFCIFALRLYFALRLLIAAILLFPLFSVGRELYCRVKEI